MGEVFLSPGALMARAISKPLALPWEGHTLHTLSVKNSFWWTLKVHIAVFCNVLLGSWSGATVEAPPEVICRSFLRFLDAAADDQTAFLRLIS